VWLSDTPRNNTVNHHGIGTNAGVVVAPAAENSATADDSRYACALIGLEPADGDVRWRWGVPRESCFLHALTRPAVADLDGDETQEVVVGTTEEALVVLGADGEERVRIPTPTYSYAQPTVADLTGDGAPEIVASDITGNVTVANRNGTVLWRDSVSGSVWDSPLVVDVDGDGHREVVVGSNDEVVAFDRDGAALWRRDVASGDVAVGRVDGDRVVVTAGRTGAGGIRAFDGATGEQRWRADMSGARLETVSDGDGDAADEVYVSLPGGVVTALVAADGSEEWRTRVETTDGLVTPAPVLADLDGADDPELVVATETGSVSVLDPADGGQLAAYERDVPVWTPVTPANLTDSPGEEILVRYGDGRVVALEYAA